MDFTAPIPFAEALGRLRARRIAPTTLGTAELRQVSLAIRERAFFSSKVESARVLQAMKDSLDDYLAGARMDDGGFRTHSRSEFVADMRELAIRVGLGRIDPATGLIDPEIRETDLRDIRSLSRLQLVFDTVTEAAQEYGYYAQGQSPEILDVWPAQRFIRVRPVVTPRPYHAAAEGEVRRKDDLDFWIGLNRDFNVPWGPWGFGSGMGVEDVDRDEAESLGVIASGETVKPALRDFNEGLAAGTQDIDGDIRAALRRATGGTPAKGSITPRPAPARPASLAAALKAAGVPDDGDITADQARVLIDSLRHPAPALAVQKITTFTGAQKKGRLTRAFITEAADEFLSFLPSSLVDSLPEFEVVVKRSMPSAGTYAESSRVLTLNAKALQDRDRARKTIFHELSHWVHDHSPKPVKSRIRSHFVARTQGEPIARLRPWNSPKIVGKRDKWADADGDEYAGRIYPWETVPAGTELLTRHFEKLSDPAAFARHWNHKADDGSHAWRETFTELSHILFP